MEQLSVIEELLVNESPIVIDKSLARDIGLRKAVILNVVGEFEFASLESLQARLHFMNERALYKHLRELERMGFISRKRRDVSEIVVLLKNKQFNDIGIGNGKCAWCGVKTLVLVKHHFPETELAGGHEVVKICATCHVEFHHLVRGLFYSVSEVASGEFSSC